MLAFGKLFEELPASRATAVEQFPLALASRWERHAYFDLGSNMDETSAWTASFRTSESASARPRTHNGSPGAFGGLLPTLRASGVDRCTLVSRRGHS
jgi:hypothetical protein